MTQGDQQQHPSGTTTAACSSCPKDADSAESRGSSPPVETVSSSAGMEGRPPHHPHHHHPHYRKEHTTAASASDGDVKTLLHFVNLASSDIKAALDKSAPLRKSSENRKYLQKQLKRSPPPFFTEDEIYMSSSTTVSPGPPVVAHDHHGFSPRRFISNLNSSPSNHQSSSLHFSERLMASASLHRDHIKNSDLNLIKELTFGNIHRGTDQLLGKRTSHSYRDKQHVPSGREFTDMATLSHEEGGKDRENPVPLRKRRLPASFWQEPGKSENHKTAPAAMAGLSPIAMNASLKFPLIPSLTQGFTDSRPTSLDKNAIYPSSDHQCFPGQSFMPSLSNSINSENYLNRTLNFPYSSICSCHQHTELYGYDHGPACATYASRHGGDAPGIFTPIGPTGIISSSRWHVPSLSADRPDMCLPPSAPRVVKPIPTKSISSYPHRYHPIYT